MLKFVKVVARMYRQYPGSMFYKERIESQELLSINRLTFLVEVADTGRKVLGFR